MVKPTITLSGSFWLNKCNVEVWQLLRQHKNVRKKNRCRKNHNKKEEAYATDKQTSKVNSRNVILRPVIYQNKFDLFWFYSLSLTRWFLAGFEIVADQWQNSLFLSVSSAQKHVLLIDLNISHWVLPSWDCLLSVGNHFSARNSAVILLSSSHARMLGMFYCI